MSDVLVGMTRKEAEEFVAACEISYGEMTVQVAPPAMDAKQCRTLLALAALGARCVGAREAVVWASDCEPEPPWDGRCESLKRRVLVPEGE